MLESIEDSSLFSQKVDAFHVSPASKHQSYLDMPLQLANQRLLSSCAPRPQKQEDTNSSESNTEFNINALVTTEGDKIFTTSKEKTNMKSTPLATLDYAVAGGFSERHLFNLIDGCSGSNSIMLKLPKRQAPFFEDDQENIPPI